MLMDIVIEELSYLEIIGILVGMLNKGVKGVLVEGIESEVEFYCLFIVNGNDSYIIFLLYGGGILLINLVGVLWMVVYIDIIGEFIVDLWLNVVVEVRVKIVYECLINVIDDSGVKDVLVFLMICEVVYQFFFEKVLQLICNNYLLGKLLFISEYVNIYYNMFEGGEVCGSWNSDKYFDYVKDLQLVVDGGDGSVFVGLMLEQEVLCKVMLK